LIVDTSGAVTGLVNDQSENEKWINCGAYLTDVHFFDMPLVGIPVRDKTEYSLPHTLIQDPVERPVRLVAATQWFPVGTPEELAKAEKILDNI
jgi:NDP-sugar pyrophosphorylase family protein